MKCNVLDISSEMTVSLLLRPYSSTPDARDLLARHATPKTSGSLVKTHSEAPFAAHYGPTGSWCRLVSILTQISPGTAN